MVYLNTTTWEFGGFFSTKIGTRMSVSSSRKDSFSKFQNERKQVKSSLSAVQPTEILGYDSST